MKKETQQEKRGVRLLQREKKDYDKDQGFWFPFPKSLKG
jgi:hypothetical protein